MIKIILCIVLIPLLLTYIDAASANLSHFYQLSSEWIDDTEQWDETRSKVTIKADDGIFYLSRIKRKNGKAYCKFRNLKYTSNETGYYWSKTKLASEIAKFRKKITENFDPFDFENFRVDMPTGYKKPHRIETISEGNELFGQHEVGVSFTEYLYGDEIAEDTVSLYVFMIPVPQTVISVNDSSKYFIATECDIGGAIDERDRIAEEVFDIIESIDFNFYHTLKPQID